MMYSIIDIETTGSFSGLHKVTEIAIIVFDGNKIVDSYQTLINPQRNIPSSITRLTGITNAMVSSAPPFYKVAKKIVEMTQSCVFVAHNVNFDYNILKSEFSDLGYNFKVKKLCTVRLARKALPGHASYSLGKICKDLGIEISNRHRAMGDAKATLELFKKILTQLGEDQVFNAYQEAELQLPQQLNYSDLEDLPQEPGIYFLKDKEDCIIYIGKSINIQKRVKSHFKFKNGQKKAQRIFEETFSIDYILSGSDLAARLLECEMIKKHRPRHNRSLNRARFRYCLALEADKAGYLDVKIRSNSQLNLSYKHEEIKFFSKKTASLAKLEIYKKAFGIHLEHPKYSGAIDQLKATLDALLYNKKIEQQFEKYFYPHSDFDVRLKGRDKDEHALIEFRDHQIQSLSFIKNQQHVQQYKLSENSDMKNIFLSIYNKKKLNLVKKSTADTQLNYF